jgi:GH18 family chitinase
MHLFRKNSLLLSVFLLLTTVAVNLNGQTSSFRIVGYVPNWIDVSSFTQNFNFKQVTHINYAFQNPNSTGDLVESNTGLTILIEKAHQNNVKVLISLGGAGSADAPVRTYYQDLISTSAKRANFIHKIVIYLNKFKLDGLDVDEEGPAINSNYGAFIKQLADSLKPQGKLLTAAVGWGAENIPNSCLPLFDWVNLMSYDLTGSWDLNNPGQHSPYWYAQQMIKEWKIRGVKKENLCLGLPFYGYGFYKMPGSYNYIDILARFPEAWQKDQVGDTIYYNGMSTIWKKTKLAMNETSGVMIWELSNDVKSEKSLLKVISSTVDSLKTSTSNNLKKPKGISIYPNPAGNELVIDHLNSLKTSSIEVLNLLGELKKTFYSENGTGKISRIDISSLANGAYICRLNSPEGIYSGLFLKK